MSEKKGLFITLEGIDGSGKSTQSKLLYEYIKNNITKKVVLTREPGGTDIANEIRNIILTGEPEKLDTKTEAFLFLASRAAHWNQKIKPTLDDNFIVICDRFHDSTIAYQSLGVTENKAFFENAYKYIAGNRSPDLTFLIDIEPEIAIKRSIEKSGNQETRFEKKNLNFHNNVRNEFLQLAAQNPQRFVIIQETSSVHSTSDAITSALKTFLNNLPLAAARYGFI